MNKFCFCDDKGVRRLNDLLDPYRSLSALTLHRVQFTDRILHLNRETWKKKPRVTMVRGVRKLNDPFDPYGS